MARGSLTPIDQQYKAIIAGNLHTLAGLKNVKQIEIVRATGISSTTMSGYFNGTRLPTPENVSKLADFFHVSEEDIDPRFAKEAEQKDAPTNAIPLEDFDIHRIPVIGTIACGEPIDAEQNVIDYMTILGDIPKDAFALVCEGSSMEPGLHDGDRVIIEPTPDVEDGEIAAVLVDGDTKATLKRIKHVGETIELIPDNSTYGTIILDKEHPGRILGKKIQMIRYGSR